jgi:hypothetical protein
MIDTRRRPDDEDDELRRRARHLLSDKDLVKEFSDTVHDHFWQRTWQRVTSSAGKWLLVALVSGIAGRVVVYGAQNGWFK